MSFSHDGQRIVFNSNASGVYNAYVVDAHGGPASPLISSTTSLFAISFFPNDDRILYTKDDAGDENDHLIVRTPAGQDTDLTTGAKTRATFLSWDASGKAFYFRSNARDEKVMDVYRTDTTTFEKTLLFRNDDAFDVARISGDGRWIALTKSPLAALAFSPDTFAAGVDFYGPSNWVHTLEAIPPYWESYRKALIAEIGDPVADRAMLESISPFFHTANIRKPLMVVQGERDPRVARKDTDAMVEAIRRNGIEVEYRVFAAEGHGLTKREDQIEAFRSMLEFLDHQLHR